MVALVVEGRPKCGGTLVASKYVISAAHCTQHLKDTFKVEQNYF